MSKAIDDLKHEHDAILSALRILQAMNRKIAAGAQVPRADLEGFTGFLKEFADKCHHGKEEGILFPALAKAGLPAEGGPVGVMLSEHAQGRQFIRDMETAIASADNKRFAVAADAYASLLSAHIQKENSVLFPMADKILETGELDGIGERFEQFEETVIGKGRHEELHAMLKELRGKYPG
jgi:hemerythrin-like domain-containing protein